MQSSIQGQIALITGGASGIGRAISARLACDGAKVIIADISRGAADLAVAKIEKMGGEAQAVVADVTDYAGMSQAIDGCVRGTGRIDILVNNAGWDKGVIPFLKNDPRDWQKIIAVNLMGALNCTHLVAKVMSLQKSGKIINIGSDSGRGGSFGEAVYGGCKAALISLTKTWAREFARDGIRVNCICPGLVDTPLLSKLKEEELGKKVLEKIEQLMLLGLGKPEDIANVVSFFASSESSHITGQILSVSGGLTFHG
jgi:2-hydroxycyclohexanecarboxyl-CoA dehydrogenase